MKKFIKKINNAIQWTKKFHFFHITLVTPVIISTILVVLSIFDWKSFEDIWSSLDECYLLFNFLFIIVISPIAIICQIIIFLISKKTHKKIYVSQRFQINKVYNILYIISCLIFIFSASLWLFVYFIEVFFES